uniref:Death domain-containing protein n=2 Tax=Amphimedon queenslandica TaxID=400682 RepID=A0A1X7T0B9_AMPQE
SSFDKHEILFPRDMKDKFEVMRLIFGSAFMDVKHVFTERKLSIDYMKELIIIWYPDLEPQLSYKETIGEVLNVLKRKCNIINLRPLEVLASKFSIEEAKPVIKSFKEKAKDFCKSVSVSLCLGEELQAVATPSRLLCETIFFIFNWNPVEYTLQDINDVLDELEPLNKYKYHLQIDRVGTGQSVVVTCYCPAEYISSLIMAVLDKIGTMQKRELKEFKVGNCTIWDNTAHEVLSAMTSKEIEQPTKKTVNNYEDMERELLSMKQQLAEKEKQVQELQMKLQTKQEKEHIPTESVDELNKKVKTQYAISRRKTMEIEDLKATMRQKEIDTQKELASLKELSEIRLQEIEQLKLKLEDNNSKSMYNTLNTTLI